MYVQNSLSSQGHEKVVVHRPDLTRRQEAASAVRTMFVSFLMVMVTIYVGRGSSPLIHESSRLDDGSIVNFSASSLLCVLLEGHKLAPEPVRGQGRWYAAARGAVVKAITYVYQPSYAPSGAYEGLESVLDKVESGSFELFSLSMVSSHARHAKPVPSRQRLLPGSELLATPGESASFLAHLRTGHRHHPSWPSRRKSQIQYAEVGVRRD